MESAILPPLVLPIRRHECEGFFERDRTAVLVWYAVEFEILYRPGDGGIRPCSAGVGDVEPLLPLPLSVPLLLLCPVKRERERSVPAQCQARHPPVHDGGVALASDRLHSHVFEIELVPYRLPSILVVYDFVPSR